VLNSPKLVKGALITISDRSDVTVIAFQYNPETLTRNVTPHYIAGEQNNSAERMRFQGAPSETINAVIIVDAIDQLAQGKGQKGIHPQLAALELLGAPAVDDIRNSEGKTSIEILPWLVPTTIFVYGENRVAPVRVDSVSISEELHDPDLNPIWAKVTISMTVITCSTTLPKTKAYEAWMAYQKGKERIAKSAQSTAASGGGNPRAAASDYLRSFR
jgi:Contractile injection system tube protein